VRQSLTGLPGGRAARPVTTGVESFTPSSTALPGGRAARERMPRTPFDLQGLIRANLSYQIFSAIRHVIFSDFRHIHMWRCDGRIRFGDKIFFRRVNSFGLVLRHGLFGGDFSSCITEWRKSARFRLAAE
jgi:hypothetical protein